MPNIFDNFFVSRDRGFERKSENEYGEKVFKLLRIEANEFEQEHDLDKMFSHQDFSRGLKDLAMAIAYDYPITGPSSDDFVLSNRLLTQLETRHINCRFSAALTGIILISNELVDFAKIRTLPQPYATHHCGLILSEGDKMFLLRFGRNSNHETKPKLEVFDSKLLDYLPNYEITPRGLQAFDEALRPPSF